MSFCLTAIHNFEFHEESRRDYGFLRSFLQVYSMFCQQGRTGNIIYFIFGKYKSVYRVRRSQWQRSLKHEMSSISRILESWVRIPLKAWMFFLRLFCLCFVLCR
jgi:hypothetical protein